MEGGGTLGTERPTRPPVGGGGGRGTPVASNQPPANGCVDVETPPLAAGTSPHPAFSAGEVK